MHKAIRRLRLMHQSFSSSIAGLRTPGRALQDGGLRAAERLAYRMQVIVMQVDQAGAGVFPADPPRRRINLLVDGVLAGPGPFAGVRLAMKGFGQHMTTSADLNPPFGAALLNRRHRCAAPNQPPRPLLDPGAMRAQQLRDVRQQEESLANIWAQTTSELVCPTL